MTTEPENIVEIEIIELEIDVEIKEPEFEIVSIVILQADLVVTKFEAILRVINPNDFALELDSITYELYGNGVFWADGYGKNIIHIPPLASYDTNFIFDMNFIDMDRRLLDDVIAMRNIRYRFRGEAEIQPVIFDIEPFRMRYDCSGFSEVRKRN
jgi:LEA14-like dessication related protein